MTDVDPIEEALTDGRTTLTEPEGKRLLADAGVAIPTFEVVETVTGAVDAANTLGYPVVVKVSSPTVTHKSEWADAAGVNVGLDSPEMVRDAADDILEAAQERNLDVRLLVEELVDTDGGTEVIVGGLHDASFGTVVMTGLGGVFTELYEDTSHRIAPIEHAEALRALHELTAAPLFEGYRGRPPADKDSLATVLTTVGDLVSDRTEIAEIEVNPVLALPNGAVALDALVVLNEEDNRPHHRA